MHNVWNHGTIRLDEDWRSIRLPVETPTVAHASESYRKCGWATVKNCRLYDIVKSLDLHRHAFSDFSDAISSVQSKWFVKFSTHRCKTWINISFANQITFSSRIAQPFSRRVITGMLNAWGSHSCDSANGGLVQIPSPSLGPRNSVLFLNRRIQFLDAIVVRVIHVISFLRHTSHVTINFKLNDFRIFGKTN